MTLDTLPIICLWKDVLVNGISCDARTPDNLLCYHCTGYELYAKQLGCELYTPLPQLRKEPELSDYEVLKLLLRGD